MMTEEQFRRLERDWLSDRCDDTSYLNCCIKIHHARRVRTARSGYSSRGTVAAVSSESTRA